MGMGKIIIADIMTKEPVVVKPGTNLAECTKKMVAKNVGSLLIVDGKKLVGILTEKDILWALLKKAKKELALIKAEDISTKKIATIKPDITIREAISRMKKLKFERLPVVHENKLVGIVTVKDILNFNPEFYPELEEFAKIREQSAKLKRFEKTKDSKFVIEGLCEQCGKKDLLCKINGMLLCESCKDSI